MRQLLAILIISLIIIGCGKSIVGNDYKDQPTDEGPTIQRACNSCHGWDYQKQEIPRLPGTNMK